MEYTTRNAGTKTGETKGKVLILAEKPAVAEHIAALAEADRAGPGFYEGPEAVVTWCNGHLLTIPPWYVPGDDGQLILPAVWELVPTEEGKEQLGVLRALLRRNDLACIINACDNDREGDLIFANLMEYLDCSLPAWRMVIRSCTDRGLTEALTDLRPMAEFDDRTDAARCRSRTDWLLSVNVPRLFFRQQEGHRPGFGRTQMAVLHLLGDREEAVRRSREEIPWRVKITTIQGDTMLSEEMDYHAAQRCVSRAPGRIVEVSGGDCSAEEVTEQPCDLTTLQAMACPVLHRSGDEILEILRGLYRRGLITYPRTSGRTIPRELLGPAQQALFQIAGREPGETRGEAAWTQWRSPEEICAGEPSAHPPLLILPAVTTGEITQCTYEEQYLLACIALQMMKCFLKPAMRFSMTTYLTCDGAEYTMTRTYTAPVVDPVMLEVPGFGSLGTACGDETPETPLSQFVEEAELIPCGEALRPYTESEMLVLMSGTEEEQPVAIGTAGTRAGILWRMKKNGTIRCDAGRLILTDRGRWILRRLPEEITSPDFTREMEYRLSLVESGDLTEEEYMTRLTELLRQLRELADVLPPLPEHREVGTCPICGKTVLEGERNYHCSDRRCRFVLWKDLHCQSTVKARVSREKAEELLRGRLCLLEIPDDPESVVELTLSERNMPSWHRIPRTCAA